VVDMLTILVSEENDQIEGIIPHLVNVRLSILQYVDDTFISIDNDI
jgi:hypothetical protein